MKPSLIIPPSIFYTQIAPNIQDFEECYFYINLFIDYYDFLTDFIFKFHFRTGSLSDPKHYKFLSDERTNIINYIQELQDVAETFD